MSEIAEDLIAEAITEQFGERCPDFESNCFCCKVWKQYDDLRALQDERDGGWQPIETCSYRDGDPQVFAWDGHSFDVVYFGWMEEGKPVWFNGDVPFDAVMWRPLPTPPHSKANEG